MAETTKAHTEVPSDGHKGPFPPFQKENFPSQLLWFAITFIVLYVFAAKVALPRIGGIFEQRRDRVSGDLAQAQRLKGESEEALKAYEKALGDARSRAQAIASETHQKLAAEAEERRKVLETNLNAKLAEAEKTIDATKRAAMANVQGIAVEVAGAIVERLVGAVPAGASVESAVKDALKR